jgi:hypothetical protein
VNEVCKEKGVPLAKFLYPPFRESVKAAVDDGFNVLVVGGDISLLYHTSSEIVKVLKEI